jgi:hypothetical protein
MRSRTLLLTLFTIAVLNTSYQVQAFAQSRTRGLPDSADSAKLLLTTKILKEHYCDSPDPDFVTLRLLLRLSFANAGNQKVILQRGGKSVPVARVSKTVEDSVAKRFENTINYTIITSSSEPQKSTARPPLRSFAILSPGETYQTVTEISLPVARSLPMPPGINPGNHHLQIEVSMWDEAESDATLKRKTWMNDGFLWSESILSKPMSFTVRTHPNSEDCNCETAKTPELEAIEIGKARMKRSRRAPASYKSSAVSQGCEWQVVFEPVVKHHNRPSFIFIIDKHNGKVLAEFQ